MLPNPFLLNNPSTFETCLELGRNYIAHFGHGKNHALSSPSRSMPCTRQMRLPQQEEALDQVEELKKVLGELEAERSRRKR